jgi:hypothetical protein
MHYFQGRSRWTIALVFAIVFVVLAIVVELVNVDMVPVAPGPLPTPTSIGALQQ